MATGTVDSSTYDSKDGGRRHINFADWLEKNTKSGLCWPDDGSTVLYIFWDRAASKTRTFCMRDMLEYMNDWIAKAAYYIWEDEGRPVDRDMEHWFRALQQFIEAHS